MSNTAAPAKFSLHPILAETPSGYSDAEFDKLVEDISAHGQLSPILVNQDNQILDGRHRWRVALHLQQPVRYEVTDVEPVTVILQSLLRRRHNNKGALSFMAWPLVECRCNDGRRKDSAFPSESEIGGKRVSMVDLATELGVSWDLLDAARAVHTYLKRKPEDKARWETLILSGDLSILRAKAGIAGAVATKGEKRKEPDPVALARTAFDSVTIRLSADRWKKIPDKERVALTESAVAAVAAWPEEVQDAIATALETR